MEDAIKFADFVIENYAKVKSQTGMTAYVNIKTNKVLVNGSPSYYTKLINEHGKSLETIYEYFIKKI